MMVGVPSMVLLLGMGVQAGPMAIFVAVTALAMAGAIG